jgi:Ca2+-binding EF-hand superfamily protein
LYIYLLTTISIYCPRYLLSTFQEEHCFDKLYEKDNSILKNTQEREITTKRMSDQTEKERRRRKARALKHEHKKKLMKDLATLPHDFRSRLNSEELKKVGKEFLLNAHGEDGHKALSVQEFEIAMGHLGFDDLPMINRIFEIFDNDNSGSIDYREMVCGIDLLLRGHGEETLKFCFSIYDLDDSGYIGEHELFSVLKLCSKHDLERRSGGKKRILGTLRKIWRNIDKNGDGKISFEEFVGGLREEPLLVRALLQEGPSHDGDIGSGEAAPAE